MSTESLDSGTVRLDNVFDQRVLQILRPLVSGLAAVFALALVFNLLEGLPQQAVLPLVATKVVLVVWFVVLSVALRREWIPRGLANPVGVGVAGLTLFDVLLALALVGDPFYLAYVVIVLIGLGSVLLSVVWLVCAIGGATVAWLTVALPTLGGQDVLHYGLALIAASVVSVVICQVRREGITETETALDAALREANHRRKAEEAAAKSSARLSLAISASKGGWWYIDFDPERPEEKPDEMQLGPMVKAFIGFEDHEFPNSRAAWKERIYPEDRPATEAAVAAHLSGEALLLEARYRVRHKDGSLRWIHSSGRIERDEKGRPLGASGIAWDVTERVESDDRLRKLSRAVEHSSSVVIITDTDAKIEYVNPKFTRTTGYTPEEVIGKTPAMLWGEKSDRTFENELWETLLSGHEWQGEFENVKKNGERYSAIASISPIKDRKGETTHFVAVQEDITERKRVEAQLIQAQKMEGVGQLVSGVAHDFNNLLTGIVGFADLSLSTVGEDEALRTNLEQISKAGDSAMSLTRKLLAFSRQQVLQPRVVDLNRVILDFEELLRRTISENIELVIKSEPELGRVNVDPSQMEQILVNLAVNARDAMPGGGRLAVETSNIEVGERYPEGQGAMGPGHYVCLEVSDTGVGMEEQTRDRAFEPFFTTKERGRGTGLGLATVYGIVRQSGGHIEVESEIGEGTTFKICLPRVEEPLASESVVEQAEKLESGSEKILLVEDDDLVRAFALRLLRNKGYEVLETGNPEEALEIARGEQFDLLVSDVVMPGMSGVELAEELGRERPGLRVLFLSGYADVAIIEEKLLDPAVTFLSKPFAIDEFLVTVRGLLNE